MRINAYVDAFNFYYGLTKNTPHRWCDLSRLCALLLPHSEVRRIKVFTAYSKAFPDNPGQPDRQRAYLRALKTIPNLEIHTSRFLIESKYLPLADLLPDQVEMVKVKVPREKGSDVKLASHLLLDAFQNDYDMAVVFTNDSDLAEPIQMVRYFLHKRVGVFLTCRPPGRRASKQLMEVAHFHKLVTPEMLSASQFPPVMTDHKGRPIRKPESW